MVTLVLWYIVLLKATVSKNLSKTLSVELLYFRTTPFLASMIIISSCIPWLMTDRWGEREKQSILMSWLKQDGLFSGYVMKKWTSQFLKISKTSWNLFCLKFSCLSFLLYCFLLQYAWFPFLLRTIIAFLVKDHSHLASVFLYVSLIRL